MTAARPEAGTAGIGAIVLAAGRSSRMGRLKPLLPFGPDTVLAHVVGELRAAGIDDPRVVVGHHADETMLACAALGVRPVLNPDWDRGMFSSIRAGIASLPVDLAGTLLLPVDVPLVRASTFAAILA
ncbi:MAG: nucleotidyltransferase family protein, partial [Phyllobacteriaceae bacterium]|nr:nucleotidyltransferase family protein [Phyllobacteriaceae bacterium]